MHTGHGEWNQMVGVETLNHSSGAGEITWNIWYMRSAKVGHGRPLQPNRVESFHERLHPSHAPFIAISEIEKLGPAKRMGTLFRGAVPGARTENPLQETAHDFTALLWHPAHAIQCSRQKLRKSHLGAARAGSRNPLLALPRIDAGLRALRNGENPNLKKNLTLLSERCYEARIGLIG